ncbi:competence type IV pilus minor pilin ComGD [Lactococcus protaetiae]|uniref:Type II secretion system protein n=1 Tax=Lactococcus protaetiae TaxID=2592653 RepID=A0A514Z625_9LACT|nr:competence type IV pilus minor pilin ComGD [Lactococcus protaetiae]QDK70051.1 type II secretion system protein [Lactococcus protaetiae]
MRKIREKHVNWQIRAFTLAESLLVLTVISFLTLIFSSVLTKTVHLVRGELFVLQFENLYKNTQEDAALLSTREDFGVSQSFLTYENHRLKIPDEVRISDFSIQFDEQGENSSLKKIKILLPDEQKTVSYQLEMGSGKFKKTVS